MTHPPYLVYGIQSPLVYVIVRSPPPPWNSTIHHAHWRVKGICTHGGSPHITLHYTAWWPGHQCCTSRCGQARILNHHPYTSFESCVKVPNIRCRKNPVTDLVITSIWFACSHVPACYTHRRVLHSFVVIFTNIDNIMLEALNSLWTVDPIPLPLCWCDLPFWKGTGQWVLQIYSLYTPQKCTDSELTK